MKPNNPRNGKVPELLAPAGNIETALAAYSSGADAVYFGLDKYNARIPAENFSIDDLARISGYAKQNRKRFYITFNTLIKQGELEDAFRQIETIVQYEPDALIVQDLGIVEMLRQSFPHIPVHASTQMGIHNSAGIRMAERLGIERVILERQVSMDELKAIAGSSPLEIEVFIHGALCCSLSGRCLFSSWIGGWSGNRGRCKQPCRRRYYGSKSGRKKSGFFFSTQDLYSLDLIPDLKRIGVASLKIEGRLKKPDYVQNVVSAYRMMLDSSDGEDQRVLSRARQVLAGSYGRRWSHGFATAESMQQVIQDDSAGVSGLLIGTAEGIVQNKLRVNLSRKLHVGDRVRVQRSDGQEGSSFTVRGLEQNNRRVISCSSGMVLIPVEGEVSERGKLYKISQSIRRSGPSADSLKPFVPRPVADIQVRISPESFTVKLIGRDGAVLVEWEKQMKLQAAEKHEIDQEEVKRVFRAADAEDVRIGRIYIDTAPGLFMPPSILKKLRREFWVYAEETGALQSLENPVNPADTGHYRVPAAEAGRGKGKREKIISWSGHGRRVGRSAAREDGFNEKKADYRIDDLYTYTSATDEIELPHFCSESALGVVSSKIEEAIQSGVRRFRVTDLYQFELLKGHENIEMRTGFPLPVTNSLSAGVLGKLGVSGVQAWIELAGKDIEELMEMSSSPVEIYRYGRPFILVTRARLPVDGPISDPRGKKFRIEYSPSEKLTYLFPIEMLRIPEIEGTDEFWDFRRESRDEKEYSRFNFETEYV